MAQMKQGQATGDTLEGESGNAAIDAGGDPYDQTYLMNKKFARIAGSPVGLVDRDFQRAQRQAPRSLLQNTPVQWHGARLSNILLTAARGRGGRGRKKI